MAGSATIRLYGVIGDWWDGLDAATVVRAIDDVPAEDELHVRINSGGGFVFDGLPIYNTLKQRPGPVIVHIDGLAASMASAIAMAGDRVIVPGNALLMIHNPWNGVVGNAEALRKAAERLDKVGTSLLSIYSDKTGMDAAELRAMLEAETWMNADEALALGFVDEVLGSAEGAEANIADAQRALEAFSARVQSAAGRAEMAARDQVDELDRLTACDRMAAMATRIPAARAAAVSRPAPPATPNQETDMSGTTDTTGAAATTPNAVTEAAAAEIASRAITAERARVDEIQGAVRAARLPALLGEAEAQAFTGQLLRDGVSADAARKQIIDKLATTTAGVEIHGQVRIQVGQDAQDKFRVGATAAIQQRAGLAAEADPGEFRGLTLRELARESLHRAGVKTAGMAAMDMIGMAFTYGHGTGDFPYILENTARKAMLMGWEEAEETFAIWTGTGTLTDFKIHSRVDLNLFPSLSEVPEGGEYSYATMGDRRETVQLATYGKLFGITRQAIINDDLGAFTRIPRRMGRAAIRTVGNLAYAQLTANALLSDGVALFDAATHGNYDATGTPPTVTSVGAGRTAMATQSDPDGHATGGLNIRPAYWIGPVALEDTARVLFTSEFDPNATTERVPNPFRGRMEVVTDARLDTASSTAWYLAASPMTVDTVDILYLDGQQQPMLEQKDGWSIDGTEFKVRMDAAAKVWDYRGLYKDNGTGG